MYKVSLQVFDCLRVFSCNQVYMILRLFNKIFMHPAWIIGCTLFLFYPLFVRLSVCLSNLCHNFWTVRDGDLIGENTFEIEWFAGCNWIILLLLIQFLVWSGLEIHACKLAKCELKFSFASWKYRHSKKVASSIFHLIPNPNLSLKDFSASLQ